MRTRLALPLAFALLLLAGCDSAPKVAFADAAITLPEDPNELPEAPGRQLVMDNCTGCHSPSLMLQQPAIPRDKWEATVAKMIKVYKAPVDETAVPGIVDYLVAVQDKQRGKP